ncbi:Solute carrier family 35 member F5 [Wickerhamomyces ciferrii]|uniref:Solute carrier family 35 member F5 n=1 Tax=Wickerhamomyces ciferrii (strain ATCC 14091 / BCRC 22168 / CBS 111 / JCM 3599 / NBRC 0793 / NRRL Y-1031 F-60-10) TaxID=1206466 RepID=K0KF35_WICCF|nr:Solute carrier family 35 member F5 [Wickerhamomyces ciferrii]CCH40822.1 Solute carrier family 35 member F5 [Wickerhamomyces ciferrii]
MTDLTHRRKRWTLGLIMLSIKILKNYYRNGSLHYKEIEQEFLNSINSSDDEEISLNSENEYSSKLSLNDTIKLSAQFCIVWYLANLSTNASLSYTSVGSQTILSSTSSFFTLIIGALVKTESFSNIKVWGLIISFIGVIIITKTDSDSVSHELERTPLSILIGNSLALIGALLYGIYTTLLKYKIKDESRINMKVFFGFVGVFNLFFLWPSLIIFHLTGIEKFELPSGTEVIVIILINCLITFISDFCWVKAMLLTSPLIVTVGLSTTIPLAMIGDLIFKNEKITFLYIIGALMIGISFFVINRDAENEKHIE